MSICVITHYESLRLLNDYRSNTKVMAERPKVLAALSGAIASHLLQISLFGVAYYWLRDRLGLGSFGGTFEDSMASFMISPSRPIRRPDSATSNRLVRYG